MASDNTRCLQKIDFYRQAHVFRMDKDDQKIYDYCVKQGAKNQLGIFIEERGSIALWLKIEDEVCDNFFFKYPREIAFDPETHLIWVKRFYQEVDLGLSSDLFGNRKDKETGEYKPKLNHSALYSRNNFITKIKSVLRTDFALYKHHPLLIEWVKYNRPIFEKINEEVKSIKGNKYNLDDILSLCEKAC